MKIVVCVKQVPNTMEVKIDPKTGTLMERPQEVRGRDPSVHVQAVPRL